MNENTVILMIYLSGCVYTALWLILCLCMKKWLTHGIIAKSPCTDRGVPMYSLEVMAYSICWILIIPMLIYSILDRKFQNWAEKRMED